MNNELITSFDISKASILDTSSEIIRRVNDGELNPLEVKIKIKAIEQFNKIISDAITKDATFEAAKHGARKFSFMGASVELAEVGTKYDYSGCGHVKYNELVQKMNTLQSEIKEVEAFLKAVKSETTLVDNETGEVYTIFPPVKTSTSSIKVTIK